MKKIILFSLIGLLFISCNKYDVVKYANIAHTIKLKYLFGNDAPHNNKYIVFLKSNSHFTYVTNVNDILYGTYTTKIDPQSIGHDITFYPYIDTTVVFMCKFKYEQYFSPFDRSKIYLTDFMFINSNGDEYILSDNNERNMIIDIISKQAFNDFKYNN